MDAVDDETPDRDELTVRVIEAVEQCGVRAVPEWQVQAQLEAIESGLSREGDGTALWRRVGPKRFLAIGALAGMSVSIVAGLLVHPLALGSAAWKLRRLLYWDRGWRPTVIALFVTLDGVEGDVFEGAHALQSTAVVVNFDALEARRFEDAYGLVSPTASEVHAAVPQHGVAVVDRALASMVTRQILRHDGERYWIAF